MVRVANCTPAQGRARLQQAEAFVMVADLVLGDESDIATPGVAAAWRFSPASLPPMPRAVPDC
jgi:hypothetical protein